MNKIWHVTILTNLISWSLQCYDYTFVNQTNETYDIEVKLWCTGKNMLSGRLEPQKTLKLKGKPGCCFNTVKIHPLTKKRSLVVDYAVITDPWIICIDKKFTITKDPRFDSHQIKGSQWDYFNWKD